ncbi:hypothetical protein I3843_07G086300 [Carya illinoinensis]|nr:hypothetical protein I3843_07G086300 [Carya illinoinensis]
MANPVWSRHHGFAPVSFISVSPMDASSIKSLPPCFPLRSHSTPLVSHHRLTSLQTLTPRLPDLDSSQSPISYSLPSLYTYPRACSSSLTSVALCPLLPFGSPLSLTPICYLKTYTTSNVSRFCLHPVMFTLSFWCRV